MKKLLSLLLVFALSSCATHDEEVYLCPNVLIPRESAYIIQKANYADDFKIELIGFEGYCERVEMLDRRVATITPIFEVERLYKTEETEVDTKFFTNTKNGPAAFLGKKVYNISFNLAKDEMKKEFKGKPITVRIPWNSSSIDFEIMMGMEASYTERQYNKQLFDI